MVDTGSTKTLINPKIVKRYFKQHIQEDLFQIQSAHGITQHRYCANIPISPIFKHRINHKHYIFDFNPKYDGLIGIDLLRELNATLDFSKCQLKTPKATIPIYFELNKEGVKENFSIIISPRSEQVVQIPVDKPVSEGILDYIKFKKGCEMPAALVKVQNQTATTTIINSTENPVEITLNKPWRIEEYNPEEINFYENMEVEEFVPDELDNLRKKNLKNLRLDHMNYEEKQAIRKICYDYRDIFYVDGTPLTFTNEIKHSIRLKDETPIYTKSYRYPQVYKEEIKKQVSKLLEQDIIRPSCSPWSSPVWIVPKKMDASGKRKWRMVIDYRKLNEQTIDDKYPLPNITDVLDKLGKSQYYSCIDLVSGYHQILMDEKDIEKTAFSTEHGLYEFKRMPFGLKNAPATFERVVENVLRGIQNEKCLVYLDDIIIFSVSLEEHVQRLKLVFDRLRQANFKIQLDKSEFLKKEVAYLGHVITPFGVKCNPDYTKLSDTKNSKGN